MLLLKAEAHLGKVRRAVLDDSVIEELQSLFVPSDEGGVLHACHGISLELRLFTTKQQQTAKQNITRTIDWRRTPMQSPSTQETLMRGLLGEPRPPAPANRRRYGLTASASLSAR